MSLESLAISLSFTDAGFLRQDAVRKEQKGMERRGESEENECVSVCLMSHGGRKTNSPNSQR